LFQRRTAAVFGMVSRRAGLSATAGLSCSVEISKNVIWEKISNVVSSKYNV